MSRELFYDLVDIGFAIGAAFQLFRWVDPAIYMPERHITRIGVIGVRLWRVLKFWIAYLIVTTIIGLVFY
jgi:hypothetical protein